MLDRWAMWLCIFVLSLCYHHGNAVVRALDLTDAEIKDLAQKMRDADYDRPKFDTEFLVNFHDYKNKSINYASKP
uniref:Peptidase M12A domain-containing protein n=2 Tax=Bursaphelenchus xylophilus TaxID=6326 RepID=A0A1I7RVG4_BURXY